MKNIAKFLSVLVLIVGVLSFSVLAAPETDASKDADKTESQAENKKDNSESEDLKKDEDTKKDKETKKDDDAQKDDAKKDTAEDKKEDTETTGKETEANKKAEEEKKPEEPEVVPGIITVAEGDFEIDKRDSGRAVFTEEFTEGLLKNLEEAQEYPVVIDFSAITTEIESIEISKDAIEAIADFESIGAKEEADSDKEESEDGAKDDAENAKDDSKEDDKAEEEEEVEEPLDPRELVLKVAFENEEYSWERQTLLENNTSKKYTLVYLEDANRIKEFAPVDETSVGEGAITYKPEDDKAYGMLVVSKDKEGTWEISNEHMFGSKGVYVYSIIILVVLTFAVIIAIDLLIILLYRKKK